MLSDKLRQFLNFCFALAQPAVAALVNLEITGPSIGAISDRYPTYVVPAGYAFTIWSLIFALSLGYGIWQALPAQRDNSLLRQIGWGTASAFLASTVWMLVFQRSEFLFSGLIILWLLLSLIGVVAALYRWKHASNASFTRAEQWLVYVNFSIFLGWVTVATVANIGQILTALRWDGWGLPAETWGLIALMLAGAIAATVTAKTKGNVPYALAVIWALVAVSVNQFTQGVSTSTTTVGAVALGMALLVGAALLISRHRQNTWHATPLQT